MKHALHLPSKHSYLGEQIHSRATTIHPSTLSPPLISSPMADSQMPTCDIPSSARLPLPSLPAFAEDTSILLHQGPDPAPAETAYVSRTFLGYSFLSSQPQAKSRHSALTWEQLSNVSFPFSVLFYGSSAVLTCVWDSGSTTLALCLPLSLPCCLYSPTLSKPDHDSTPLLNINHHIRQDSRPLALRLQETGRTQGNLHCTGRPCFKVQKQMTSILGER